MYLSIKEYAKRVGLGEAFIRSLVASGQLPSILIGVRKRKINVEQADKKLFSIQQIEKPQPKTNLSFRERIALLKAGCA